MSSSATERKAPDGFALGLMVLLCACWGLQQTALKAASPMMHPMLQIGLRSAGAALLVAALSSFKRQPLGLFTGGTLWPGIGAGLLFAGEFLAVSLGLQYTTASHMAVFLYTAPVFTALGLHLWVKGEELRRAQWLGVGLALLGVTVAFSSGFGKEGAAKNVLLGDALGVLGGIFWAGTTLLIRRSALSEAPAAKTLLYQLGTGALVLIPLAGLTGKWTTVQPGPLLGWCLLFQTLIVSFASFLVWFWMLRTYLASRLSVFSFLTPLFGVTFGVLLLGEKADAAFVCGAALVLAGITVVNRRPRVKGVA